MTGPARSYRGACRSRLVGLPSLENTRANPAGVFHWCLGDRLRRIPEVHTGRCRNGPPVYSPLESCFPLLRVKSLTAHRSVPRSLSPPMGIGGNDIARAPPLRAGLSWLGPYGLRDAHRERISAATSNPTTTIYCYTAAVTSSVTTTPDPSAAICGFTS